MIPAIISILALLLAVVATLLSVVRYRTADVLNFTKRWFGLQTSIQLANAITTVNITPKGRATYLGDVQFTSRYLLCKVGSDATHIGIAGASDIPLGVVDDMTPSNDAAGDFSYWFPVDLLGMCEDTKRVQASAAIAVGAFLVMAANGQVATAPGSGAGYAIGRAKTAAANAGDIIEMIPTFPVKVAAFPY